MDPEIKQLWIAALRGGNYEQGKGHLYYQGRYCCLGVLCDLALQAGVVERTIWGEKVFGYGAGNEEPSTKMLPESVRTWAGLLRPDGGPLPFPVGGLKDGGLINLNDSAGWNFQQIAQAIEEHF